MDNAITGLNAMNELLSYVMKISNGKADPAKLTELLNGIQRTGAPQESAILVGEIVEINDAMEGEKGTHFARWNEARHSLPAGTKLYAARPASEGAAPKAEPEFTVDDPELNTLLNLASDMVLGYANMDTGIWFLEVLEKVNHRLAAGSMHARKSLELQIVESLLFNPNYEYDVGTDADYGTPFTDRVHALITEQRAAATAQAAQMEQIKGDLSDCMDGSRQARGICDAVASALGEDLDREAGSAASVQRLKTKLAEREAAGFAPIGWLKSVFNNQTGNHSNAQAAKHLLDVVESNPGCAYPATCAKPAQPTFRVTVGKMVESHQETYHVVLTNGLPRSDESLLDDARDFGSGITPFSSRIADHAESEARAWAEFLGVEFPT